MKSPLIAPVLLLISSLAVAGVTLKCDSYKKCDGYLENCVADLYSLTVHIEPKNELVIVGSKRIKADFSNAAEVSFPFTKYIVHINRYEYSAVFVSEDEVRVGWCTKVKPAW